MDDRGKMSARGAPQGPPERFARVRAAYRQLRASKDREGEATSTPESERKKDFSSSSKRFDCPECGFPAIIRDKGNSMIGIGACGHEYVFKMVRIHCATGHKFDALDETGSVHDPNIDCEGEAWQAG